MYARWPPFTAQRVGIIRCTANAYTATDPDHFKATYCHQLTSSTSRVRGITPAPCCVTLDSGYSVLRLYRAKRRDVRERRRALHASVKTRRCRTYHLKRRERVGHHAG